VFSRTRQDPGHSGDRQQQVWPRGVRRDPRRANLDLVPAVKVGDYVLLHGGFAISSVAKEEAVRTCELISNSVMYQREEELGT
jgi:hydrogenase assembly chaperone HypC/HupF